MGIDVIHTQWVFVARAASQLPEDPLKDPRVPVTRHRGHHSKDTKRQSGIRETRSIRDQAKSKGICKGQREPSRMDTGACTGAKNKARMREKMTRKCTLGNHREDSILSASGSKVHM